MGFDSLGRYTPNHKAYDHVGNIIPDIEHSEGNRPHLGDAGQVASWLPVQFWDKHFENWNVVMPGKVLAFDPDGALMLAQYGLTSQSVVYTQNDVDAGVIDIATGLPVTAAKTVVLAKLTGVRGSGWTRDNAGTTSTTSGFMGRYGVAFGDGTRKYPVGVAPYAFLQWAGGDGFNPSEYSKHNYNMQHRVALLCNYAIKLPVIPAQVTNETVDKSVTNSALTFGTQATHTRAYAQANTTGRYDKSTGTVPVLDSYPVIALALDEQNVATQTSRTLITLSSSSTSDDVSSILVNEKSSLSAVTQSGDYFVDYPVGVIFIYSSDGATVPTALSGASGTVTVEYYRTDASASVVSKFASVVGNVAPGDFLKVGANSNLVPADPANDSLVDIIAQLLCLETHPKDALDRVRTAFDPALSTDASGSMANATLGSASTNAGQLDQMPGSATAGFPDLIHFAGAADKLAIINLIGR